MKWTPMSPHAALPNKPPGRAALLAVLFLCGAIAARASDFTQAAIGTTGSNFLLQDQGARAIAMGGAYSAVTDDADSMYWNPAGLTKIPRFSATFMYTPYVADINYQSVEVAKRVSDTGVLAGGFRYQDYGSINNTDLAGNTIGTFHPRDFVSEVGWGQNIYDLSDSEVDVTMGAAMRWIHSDYLLNADGYDGDLGAQGRFYTGPYSYDLSAVAQNMGVGQNFDHTRDSTPFRFRVGGAMNLTPSFLFSLEAIIPSNNIPEGAIGAEYTMMAGRSIKLAFRAGFNSLNIQSLDTYATASFGVGVKYHDIGFDYAFVPMGALSDQVSRFSLSWNLPAKASQRFRER
jgi:hypothetical protein